MTAPKAAAPDAKMVSREPTTEMLRVKVEHGPTGNNLSGCQLGEAWRAMFDAAPAASPAQPVEGDAESAWHEWRAQSRDVVPHEAFLAGYAASEKSTWRP